LPQPRARADRNDLLFREPATLHRPSTQWQVTSSHAYRVERDF
jgi:hypothetical protein